MLASPPPEFDARPFARWHDPTQPRRKRNLKSERTFFMASDAFESDSRPGFGRGSAVRDYWLERCEGFRAVRPDGRSLGRVRRLETRGDGTVLRLSGLRSRVVPLSAVEIVWPGASVLLIAEETVHPERVRGPVDGVRDQSHAYLPSESSGRRSRRSQSPSSAPIPSWADDTLPWWELLEDDRSSVGNRISSPLARPVSQRSWPMDWGPQRASRLGSFPPISSRRCRRRLRVLPVVPGRAPRAARERGGKADLSREARRPERGHEDRPLSRAGPGPRRAPGWLQP